MSVTALSLALIIYIEAAGEPDLGIKYVASVIHNRKQERGLSYRQVISQPHQFSGWTHDIRRNKYYEAVEEGGRKWKLCQQLAEQMVAGSFKPLINANHYYNPALASPSWGRKLAGVKIIGNHKFGKL